MTETAVVKRDDALAIPPGDIDMAKALVMSGFFPNVTKASQALVKVQAGRELGFGPVASMIGIHIISTKNNTTIQLSANLMANLLRRDGRYDFRVKSLTRDECKILFLRDGQEIGESHFDMKDATAAGLAHKDVWKAYPRNMLYAAAMRNGIKWFCPEVILGRAVPMSEQDDTGADEGLTRAIGEGEIEVDDDGVIIDAVAREVPVVHAPPEGIEPNWAEFWVFTKDVGLDKAEVHQFFGAEDKPGALKDYAVERAMNEGKPLSQIVAEMAIEIENAGPVEEVAE